MDLAHSHFVAGVAFFCHCHFDLRAARGSAKKLKKLPSGSANPCWRSRRNLKAMDPGSVLNSAWVHLTLVRASAG